MFLFRFLQGYPGNLIASVTYTLNNEGDLAIHMQVSPPCHHLLCALFQKSEERIQTSSTKPCLSYVFLRFPYGGFPSFPPSSPPSLPIATQPQVMSGT
jgi:hypothetical protein